MPVTEAGLMVPAFDTFGSAWWQTSGATVAFTGLMLLGLRFVRPEYRAAYARALGWTLLAWMIVPPLVHAATGQWRWSVNLPLQWCDLTGGIAGLALLTRRQLLYEFSLFWGIACAGSALLTPQFTQGTDWFSLSEFFISHSMLLAAPLFLSIYGNMRPRSWAWLTALGWLNATALIVGVFDLLTDANYMFPVKAPTVDLPLYTIAWPYYLIGFEVACLVAFVLIALPFLVGRPGNTGADAAATPFSSDTLTALPMIHPRRKANS